MRRVAVIGVGMTKFGKHDVFGTIEAVKAVSELFAPLAGEVVAITNGAPSRPKARSRLAMAASTLSSVVAALFPSATMMRGRSNAT